MSHRFLILGNSIAGAQAAWDLAEAGLAVDVVSAEPWFVPAERDLDLRTWLLQVSRHPNIRFLAPAHLESLQTDGSEFAATVALHSRFVDLERCTNCGECEKVCPVTVPGTSHPAIWRPAEAVPDIYAIERIGRPPCSDACPGGIHVQGFVALIAQGRFDEALDLIREAIPFPAVCGRVCDHPCEGNCRRNEVDAAVSVRALKRFVADQETKGGRRPSLESRREKAGDRGTGRKVAVIGSGPAGLTVATELALWGYAVTVFEALPVAGGMLAVGIPAYRLPKDVLNAEIRAIEELGVEIRVNARVSLGGEGGCTPDALLAQGFEAVFLGVGAHTSTRLNIPNEDADGVVHGVALLRLLNLSQQTGDAGAREELASILRNGSVKRAVVIGGGNTAMDVSRSLRRLGLEEVSILYRRSRAEMPAAPEEIEDAEHEGVSFEFQVAPVRVIEEGGRVRGIECLRTRLGEPDASGRRRPEPIPGSEFVVETDLVIPAIGQSPDLGFLGPECEIGVSRRRTIEVDPATHMTSRPGVFAAGDAIDQPASVIHAIGAAKRAAAAMDGYLRGVPLDEFAAQETPVPVAHRDLAETERAAKPRTAVPMTAVDERIACFDEVEIGFDEAQAMAEASRCLSCGPCSECRACVEVCEPKAILHDWREELLDLRASSILVADERMELPLQAPAGLLRVGANDRLGASARAAEMMVQAAGWPRQLLDSALYPLSAEKPRVGVWVCGCQGQISDRLAVDEVARHAAGLDGVVYAGTLDQACSPEAKARLEEAIREQRLNRVVVAACSCCALDQVCYSCTTQRLRCKANLMSLAELGAWLEFVNIREQCAWVYEDRDEAVAVAEAAVSAAVVRCTAEDMPSPVEYAAMPSVLVVGSGRAAAETARTIAAIGLTTSWVNPDGDTSVQIPGVAQFAGLELQSAEGAFGDLKVTLQSRDGRRTASAGALVLVGATDTVRSGDGRKSGVYALPAGADGSAQQAFAASLAALLGRAEIRVGRNMAVVDEALCRACATCQTACPVEAITIRAEGALRAARIVSGRCIGCGLCAAVCPSGAMSVGAASDFDIEKAIEQACRGWR